MTTRKLVRVQEKGQVTLPSEMRRHLGLRKGDLVSVEETDRGMLITRQEVLSPSELDEIDRSRRLEGPTLEDLIESMRDARPALLKELSGTDLTELEAHN